jgi:two-component system cell cycle response regulator
MNQDLGTTTRILKLELGTVPRVLIVDDDELVLARLRDLVTAAGFETFTASSGAQALKFLDETFAPIVITDLNMPDMGGLTLCRTIRQKNWPGYIYVVLLTVRDVEEDILAGLDAGADDYLSKRASSAQLLARLRTAQRILTLEHSLKTAVAEKRHQAMTDALTGAPNRRYFMRRLTRELKRANRVTGALSIMALDIDHFKAINDRHGHSAGDAVLREFVQRIGECLPQDSDWYARMGGEEFAVVLGGRTLADAGMVAEKLLKAVALPIYTAAGPLNVTVSIGVTGLEVVENRSELTVEALCHQADQLLYMSKENGRNRVTLPRLKSSTAKTHNRSA